jgi:serine/threonine protein kinase
MRRLGGVTTLSVDHQPEPDIQIAGYRIEARLGRGGMGEVYRAVQLSLGRRVALKVLSPKLAADDVFRRRFLRESRIAASIDHPSIIPIFETGEDGGLLYIAMRYVDGMDLSTLLRREGRLEPPRALAIMAQVASALDAAHARGLVHRDVKPGNILLATGPAGGGDGHCYLCDFGLIKEVDTQQAQSALTATDQFVGTIPYVAPEQIEGRDLDGRADIYALGCVLFHCLTGSVPFERLNDIEVVFAHLREPPPPMSTRVPGLPPAMDAIVARAMAKSTDDRWPTCSALVTALQAEVRPASPAPTTPGDAETRSMQIPSSPLAAPATVPPGSPAGIPPTAAPPRPDPLPVPPPPDPVPATDPNAPTRIEPRPAFPPAPPGSPAPARPASGPPEGERAGESVPVVIRRGGPGGGVPEVIRRGGPREGTPEVIERGGDGAVGPPAVHRSGGDGRRGRGWLVAAAAIVLPVAAFLGARELLAEDQPPAEAAPTTTVVATRPPGGTRCPGPITEPAPRTVNRTAPLDAIRAHTGWSDEFVVREMRTWRTADDARRWYVKAYQVDDRSRQGRWLVERKAGGQAVVLASAPYASRGYRASDWDLAGGQEAPTGVAGCLART